MRGVDEAVGQERSNELLILLAECAQLRDAQVLLVEAPAREPRGACRRRSVRVLHLDEPVAPPVRQDRGLQIDAVDAESVKLLEQRELAGDARSASRAVRQS